MHTQLGLLDVKEVVNVLVVYLKVGDFEQEFLAGRVSCNFEEHAEC